MMYRHVIGRISTSALVILFCSANGHAQPSATEILQFLVTNQTVGTGSFERDRAAAQGTSDTIARALLASLATLPTSSSSSAFVYRLNPELGTVERATASFGPLLTERALTMGRGVATVGATLQRFRFTTLDGRPLRSGSLVTTANQFTDEPAPFDEDRLSLAIDADVTTLHLNAGVTDRLQVGVAVPVIALRVDGSRTNTYRGRAYTEARAAATVVGLADVVTRAKVSLFAQDGLGLAAAADVRLATGRRTDLLGAGSTSVRLLAIGSVDRGRVALHANAGGSLGGLAREISGAAAAAVVAGRRVTLLGEVQLRRLQQPGRIVTVSTAHPTLVGVVTQRLAPKGTALTALTLAPGVKWNVNSSWVAVANVSIPLLRQGLTSPVTPFIGLDWSGGR